MGNVPRETIRDNSSIQGFEGPKVLDLRDEFLSKECFEIREDQATKLWFTYPQPIDHLSRYYESENYISHTDGNRSLFEKVYQQAKKINLGNKYTLLRKITTGKKILDYGCGVGDFLAFLQTKDYQVTGFEPDEKARQIAKQKIGDHHIMHSSLKDSTETYDIITLWHVLEHIPNLNEILIQLRNHLKDDGTLILALPNHASHDAKIYGKHWAAYDVPRHLWHFNYNSLQAVLKQFGMKIESSYPMKLDAYYVSLLSEKYRGNQLKWISAFLKASWSNLKAKQSNQYSSMIYIVQKIK